MSEIGFFEVRIGTTGKLISFLCSGYSADRIRSMCARKKDSAESSQRRRKVRNMKGIPWISQVLIMAEGFVLWRFSNLIENCGQGQGLVKLGDLRFGPPPDFGIGLG